MTTSHHRKPILAGVLALAAGLIALTACGSSGPSATSPGTTTAGGTTAAATIDGTATASPVANSSDPATAQPGKSGGTLTFAVGSDAGCVDPQQVGSNDTIYSVRQLVDSLTDQDPQTGKIVPWLAQSWDVSSDATTFTFHLRAGVTFSDGTPLTAQVVKDNFDAVPNLGALATLAQGYLNGATTTAVDAQTVKVTFPKPNAQFLQATSTHSLGIVADASTKLSAQDRCSKGIVGSGPFTLEKYVPNQEIDLVKRSGYAWGSALFTKSGEAYLDKVVFKIVPEAGVRTGSLTSGQVDAIGAVGKADESVLQASGVTLAARANPGVVFNIGLNNSKPLFTDKAVRQAISYAIDRQAIVSSQLPTGTQPATSILSHTTPYYTDLSADLTFDQAKAKSLLATDGWAAGPDGILAKNGTRLSFTISWFTNYGPNQPSLELIQQQLKAVGIDAQLKQLQIADVVKVQQSGDFDALWGNLTRADPDILRTQYLSTGFNAYRLPASDLDTVLTAQAAAADTAKRQDLVTQAQQDIVSNAYAIPVFELQSVLGTSPTVHNLAFDASSRIQLHDTWIG